MKQSTLYLTRAETLSKRKDVEEKARRRRKSEFTLEDGMILYFLS